MHSLWQFDQDMWAEYAMPKARLQPLGDGAKVLCVCHSGRKSNDGNLMLNHEG
jgi:hypothetical protein